MKRICLLGVGYRASFFIEAINLNKDKFEIVGALVGREESIKRVYDQYKIIASTDKEFILSLKPDFIINTSSKKVNFQLSKFFLDKGIPVLQETPVALDNDNIDALAKYEGLYQIAEQYQYYPYFKKIKELLPKLGNINEMTISYAHDYHGISIIRHILGPCNSLRLIGYQYNVDITHTKTRYDDFHDGQLKSYKSKRIIMYWDNCHVLFDFNSEEYRSTIRNPYLVIRGTRGEIINDTVRYLDNNNNPVVNRLDGYMEYDDLYPIEEVILRFSEFVDSKKQFYPLAYAIEDSKLSIIMNNLDENLKEVVFK